MAVPLKLRLPLWKTFLFIAVKVPWCRITKIPMQDALGSSHPSPPADKDGRSPHLPFHLAVSPSKPSLRPYRWYDSRRRTGSPLPPQGCDHLASIPPGSQVILLLPFTRSLLFGRLLLLGIDQDSGRFGAFQYSSPTFSRRHQDPPPVSAPFSPSWFTSDKILG